MNMFLMGTWILAIPLRIVYPGAYYHVTSRGNERKELCHMDYLRATYTVVNIDGKEKTYLGFPFVKQNEKSVQSA